MFYPRAGSIWPIVVSFSPTDTTLGHYCIVDFGKPTDTAQVLDMIR